ncbi:MAG: hypothetical protein V3R36_01740, partial [Dehalococcoidales bacterium]
ATEFYPSALRSSGATPENYLKSLSQLGFTINHIDEKSGKYGPANNENLMSWVNGGGQITNLFCVRS